jgi:hypothetical protein
MLLNLRDWLNHAWLVYLDSAPAGSMADQLLKNCERFVRVDESAPRYRDSLNLSSEFTETRAKCSHDQMSHIGGFG